MAVVHPWVGAPTDSSIVIAALVTSGASVRAKVSTAADLSNPTFSAAVAPDVNGYVKLPVAGLAAHTQHYYGIEVDGVVVYSAGRFRTAPTPLTPTSGTFALGSCWIAAEDHKPAVKIKGRDVDLFIQMGDNGYFELTGVNDPDLWRDGYEDILGTTHIPDLLADVATPYMIDDHDYGVNNGDSGYFGRDASIEVYRQVVPHYPLKCGSDGQSSLYQSFPWGRVFFILTDLRTQRDTSTVGTQTASSSMLGAVQKAQMKADLLAAKAAGYGLIVWVSTNVPIADEAYQPSPVVVDDSWAEFVTERAEMWDFMLANDITNVCILSGDMHAIAMDDGTHADYATGGGLPIPVFQAAPLGRVGGNNKGGPYQYGPRLSSSDSHYGLMTVTDDGAIITVKWEAFAVNDTTSVETLWYSMTFKRPNLHRRPVKVGASAAGGLSFYTA